VEHADIYRCPEDGILKRSDEQRNRGSQEILAEFQVQGFEIDDGHASLLVFDNWIDNELDNTIWHNKVFRHERLEENILAVGLNHI